MSARRWRKPRRRFIRDSRRRSLPLQVPAGRPRSQPSCGKYGRNSVMPRLPSARSESLRLVSQEADGLGMRLSIEHAGKMYSLRLPLAGSFQASNALVAAGLCIATGEAPERVFAALEKLQGAPGRLELVGTRTGAPIFVDYAHKPDALEKALAALRPLARGRLVGVFGCGGNRDRGKRPIMGEIAARAADVVIVTADNATSEV